MSKMRVISIRNGRSRFFYSGGIKIAELISKKSWFCTVKNGRPSTVRNRMKIANSFAWNHSGLITVLGVGIHAGIDWTVPKDWSPDLTWGWAGKKVTLKEVRSKIDEALALPEKGVIRQ